MREKVRLLAGKRQNRVRAGRASLQRLLVARAAAIAVGPSHTSHQ